jgi:hypothetical protein
VRPCLGCKSVAYCDETCQKQHWPVHEKQCKKLLEQWEKAYTKEGKLKKDADAAAREETGLKTRSASALGEPVWFDFSEAQVGLDSP